MTTEKFFQEIYPILENWMDVYKQTNNEALGESLERYLSMYENMQLPDDIKAVVENFRTQKQKIDKPNRLVAWVKNHKKIVGCAGLAMILAVNAGFALSKSNEKGNDSGPTTTFVTDYDFWSRDPLTGKTLIDEGIEWKKMLAENGLFDGKFSNEDLAYYAFMAGIDGLTESRIKSAQLSEIAPTKSDAEDMLDKRTQAIETGLMTKQYKVDYSKLYPKRYEADILNQLQKDYENILANDTQENRDAIIKTLDKISNNSTGYGISASLEIVAYVNAFRNFGAQTDRGTDTSYIPEETHDTFVNYMYQNCLKIDNNSEEFKKEEHTLYDDVKTKLLEKTSEILELEKETKAISDGDMSLREVAQEIAKVKVDNKSFDGLTANEKASEESKKDAQAAVEKDYPGEKVSPSDKIITGSNGQKVIDSGKTTIVDKEGDTKPSQNVDNNGNTTTQSKEELQKLGQQGAADYYKYHGDESKKASNDPAYLAGWNAAKEADSKIDMTETPSNPTTEEHYNNNANQNTSKDEVKDTPKETTPSTPVTPEESKPVDGEIVSEETTTEEIIWGNLGTDGQTYNMNDFTGENPELGGRSK